MKQVISQKMMADIAEACMGAGALSTNNIFGALIVIKSLGILGEYDFSVHKAAFSDNIHSDEDILMLRSAEYNWEPDMRYADILDHSKLPETKKLFAEYSQR